MRNITLCELRKIGYFYISVLPGGFFIFPSLLDENLIY